MKPSPAQIKILHVLKGALGMDSDAWLTLLSGFKVRTSLDLTFQQARDLIEKLQRDATQAGVWKPRRIHSSGRANPKQTALIRRMWDDVSRIPAGDDRTRALDFFVKRIAGVDKLEWLPGEDVHKVIKALSVMKYTKLRKEHEHANNAGHAAVESVDSLHV